MSEVYFTWRNYIAGYNLEKKEFDFDHHGIYLVPWEDYPEDMKKFIDWIMVCQQHKDGVVWVRAFSDEKSYPEPKTIECC